MNRIPRNLFPCYRVRRPVKQFHTTRGYSGQIKVTLINKFYHYNLLVEKRGVYKIKDVGLETPGTPFVDVIILKDKILVRILSPSFWKRNYSSNLQRVNFSVQILWSGTTDIIGVTLSDRWRNRDHGPNFIVFYKLLTFLPPSLSLSLFKLISKSQILTKMCVRVN